MSGNLTLSHVKTVNKAQIVDSYKKFLAGTTVAYIKNTTNYKGPEMKLKSVLASICLFAASGMAAAAPTFVGSWHVGDGPQWSNTIDAYNPLEAAALLFGGISSDYTISTISADVATIDRLAWMDGNGIGLSKMAENFDNGSQYNPGVRSAYVLDNSCGIRYGNPAASCTDQFINYAFRIEAVSEVPEPSSLALIGLGLLGAGFARRRFSA